MTEHRHIELAVSGALVKAARIARHHGGLAYGPEAKTMAEFIAFDIEALDDELRAWEEREAARIVKPLNSNRERTR